MHFIIGTTNIPKSEAIEEVLNNSPYINWGSIISKYKVNSGVPDMPLTLKDIRNWAKNRVQALKSLDSTWDFYIWMEWWVYKDYESNDYWIMWVVYIEDRNWEWHYWYSYHLEVPKTVIKMLHDWDKKDLEVIMHELWADKNIWDKWGSPSVWSDGTLIRKDEFIYAAKAAIAPFFNTYYKM